MALRATYFQTNLLMDPVAAGDDRPCAGAPLTDRCAAELVMAVIYNAARFLFSLPLPTTSTAASQVVWVHLQLVTVLGLARDQGTSLLSALCRAAPLQVRAGQRTRSIKHCFSFWASTRWLSTCCTTPSCSWCCSVAIYMRGGWGAW